MGRKGQAGRAVTFCKPDSLHSLVSNGDEGGVNHNTWEWSFSIFNLKIVLNT